MKLFSKKNFPLLEMEDKEAKKRIEEAKKRKKEKNLKIGFYFCFFTVYGAILYLEICI